MARTLVSVASGRLRDRHYVLNPVTSLYERSTLLEGQRTNLLLRSEEFDNAAWTKSDTTITADSVAAPDGETTADLLTEGTVGNAAVSQLASGLSAGATVAVSRHIKRGNTDWMRLGGRNGANQFRAWFNLATGAVGSTAVVGTGVVARAYIEALDDDWYRCVVVGSVPSATSYWSDTASASADASDTRVNSATRYEWGGQTEAGTCASSYIATTTATVTRSADVLYVPFTPPPQEMTGYLRFIEGGTRLVANQRLFQIGLSGPTTDPRLLVYAGGGSTYSVEYDDGITARAVGVTGAPVIGDLVEIRVVLNANGTVTMGVSINSGGEATNATNANTLPPAWAGPRLYLNSDPAGGNVGFNSFTHVRFEPGTKTLAEMRTLCGVS